MKLLFQREIAHITTALVIFSSVFITPPELEAQGIRLPKLFNRDRDPDRPVPINRSTPDIVFSRDYGTPKPRSRKVSTVKGYEITFDLSAETNAPGKTVDYLIRDFPTAGKIVAMINNRQNRSNVTVTYFADPDSAATLDSFTFVARYPGGKISTMARCDIQIKDAFSMLEVTPAVDFGKVMLGETVEKEIVITNRGNAPFTTKLNLFAPWKVVQPAGGQIAMAANSQTRVKISFTPTFPGPASYHIPFSSGEKGSCKLSGEADVPFAIKQEEWQMQLNPQTREREVSVVVTNNMPKPYEAFLRASSRLKILGGPQVILFPNQDNKINLTLGADDVMPLDGGLEIKIKQGFSSVTNITAKTVPAKLKIEVPGQLGQEVVNFGKVVAGRSVEKGITLRNLGGELLAIDGAVEEPFRILTRVDRQLAPLESLPVTIGFYPGPDVRGAADQSAFFVARDQRLQLRLVGNALRPTNAPRDPATLAAQINPAPAPPSPGNQVSTPNPVPTTPITDSDRLNSIEVKRKPTELFNNGKSMHKAQYTQEEFQQALSPIGILTRSLIERETAAELLSPEDFQLIKSTAKSIELSWTAPRDSEVEKFDVEMRGQIINQVTRLPESVWAPYGQVEFKRIGRLVKAKILGLSPNTVYELRVFTKDINNRVSKPSQAFATKTTRTMDWTYIYLGLFLLFIIATGFGVYKVIKDRQPEEYKSEYI